MIHQRSRFRTRRFKAALAGTLAVLASATLVAAPAAADPTSARQVLKSMSDYMASQKNLWARFDVSLDVITPNVEKIQFAASGDMLMSRPDKLRVHRQGGYTDVELIYDGHTATVVDRADNLYAQLGSPGTVDQLVDQLRITYGIEMPGADLLLTRSYDELIKDVVQANHIGVGIIGGQECNHLAFRNADTDWQIWVRTGDKPLPCKFIITSKTVAAAPEYTVQFHEWKVNAAADAAAFAHKPPSGAKLVPFSELVNIGELPPPAPLSTGVNR
jgi:hypothetical protein